MALRTGDAQALYDVVCRWYALIPPIVAPVSLVIDAPFGRFAPSKDSFLTFDGIKTWMVMEIVSPLTFIWAYWNSPLSPLQIPFQAFSTSAPAFLALLFLTHYANRALISPLRTPSRSKSHLLVGLSAVTFNLVNGTLMGAYLSSPAAQLYLTDAFSRPSFWLGTSLWALGFIGNIVHDEILLNLRRRTTTSSESPKGSKENTNHYSIPYGLLYKYISYPNYFCEWIEWLGFAIAASPMPASVRGITSASPPWLFFFSEILLMFPRAYKGHQWYHQKFPDYPKERKAVVPFII